MIRNLSYFRRAMMCVCVCEERNTTTHYETTKHYERFAGSPAQSKLRNITKDSGGYTVLANVSSLAASRRASQKRACPVFGFPRNGFFEDKWAIGNN